MAAAVVAAGRVCARGALRAAWRGDGAAPGNGGASAGRAAITGPGGGRRGSLQSRGSALRARPCAHPCGCPYIPVHICIHVQTCLCPVQCPCCLPMGVRCENSPRCLPHPGFPRRDHWGIREVEVLQTFLILTCAFGNLDKSPTRGASLP